MMDGPEYEYVPSPLYLCIQCLGPGPTIRIIEREGDWIIVMDVPESEVLRATEAGYCGA